MAEEIPKKYDDSAVFSSTVNFYCITKIKDVEIPAESILNLHIYEWIFELSPRIDLVINDGGTFNEKYPLVDGDKIEVEFGINDDTENTFNIIFELMSFTIENSNGGENSTSVMRITGVLENNKLYFPLVNRSFQNKASYEVIEEIANVIGLTPDIRIQTTDNMTWLQTHMTNDVMIKDIMSRAYINQGDAIFCYTNRNSELVYTSLETETTKVDRFFATYSNNATNALVDIPKDNRTLSDGRELIVYNNIEYKNIAPTVNKNIYYGTKETHYDGTNKVTTDINSDVHTLATLSVKNTNYAGTLVDEDNYGILNNVHQNYFRSMTENKYIKEGFFSTPVMIVTKPSIELNLFDKVDLLVESQDGLSTNDVMSGKYLVGGIVHHLSNKGVYNTLVTLFRNGIEPPTFDKDLELNLTR